MREKKILGSDWIKKKFKFYRQKLTHNSPSLPTDNTDVDILSCNTTWLLWSLADSLRDQNFPSRTGTHDTTVAFIHLVVCLTTGPKPLPKRALHTVRSRASSLKWEYPLISLRSSNSFLRLLPCLPVTSIPPCIFPSITRCRRQFVRKMWPIEFAFRLRFSCRIFLCSEPVMSRWPLKSCI